MTVLAVFCLFWLVSAEAYQRVFLNLAIIRFICLQAFQDVLAQQFSTPMTAFWRTE